MRYELNFRLELMARDQSFGYQRKYWNGWKNSQGYYEERSYSVDLYNARCMSIILFNKPTQVLAHRGFALIYLGGVLGLRLILRAETGYFRQPQDHCRLF